MFASPKVRFVLSALVLLAGCESAARRSADESAGASSSPSPSNHEELPTMQLHSPAFENGGTIPSEYTGAGQDISPPLVWSGAPQDTKSFAILCEDPDAPSRENPRPEGPWVHWVIYNIPASASELPESVPRKATPEEPAGAQQGQNDFGSDNVGYRGPLPPPGSGPHRYFFRIYALDRQLDLPPGQATKKSLLNAIEGHILAEGEWMGTFERE